MTERRKPGAPPLYWALISEAPTPSTYGGRYRFYTSTARDEFVRRATVRIKAKNTGQSVEVGHDLPPPRRAPLQGVVETGQDGRCPCCGQALPRDSSAKGG